jgi:glutamate-5-semialdehyde dehydrogenase
VIKELAQQAKQASFDLCIASGIQKNNALTYIRDAIIEHADSIEALNQRDIQQGIENGLTDALLDRLLLNRARIDAIAMDINRLINTADIIVMNWTVKLLQMVYTLKSKWCHLV